jgi:uncharacterized protein (TIGR03437 family)
MKFGHRIVTAFLFCATSSITAQPVVQSVVNAASFSSSLAPGASAEIVGTQLAADAAAASSVPLPLQLNGVSVTVGSIAAPLLNVSATQISALIPFEVAILNPFQQTTVPVVVTTPDGASAEFPLKLSRNAPGIFTLSGDGTGNALVFDTNLNPISVVGDSAIVLYATGLGPTDPPGDVSAGGSASEPLNRVQDSVNVLIGEQAAEVLSAALAPGLPGTYQLTVIPKKPISNRVYLVVNGAKSNIATLPIPAGTNVANLAGSIDGLYPASGDAATPFGGNSPRGQ